MSALAKHELRPGIFTIVEPYDDPISGRRLMRPTPWSSYLTEGDADRILTDHAQAAQAQRWREALEFYAVREAYLHDDNECAPICSDEGQVARDALAPSAGQEGRIIVPEDEQHRIMLAEHGDAGQEEGTK